LRLRKRAMQRRTARAAFLDGVDREFERDAAGIADAVADAAGEVHQVAVAGG